MSLDPMVDARNDFARAQKANEHHASWLMTYQAACMRWDWDGAEVARANVLSSLDSFMDNYAAGHKRMETA